MMRLEPPGSLSLSAGLGDVIHVGSGQLTVIERTGNFFTLEWRCSAILPPVIRKLSDGYGMQLSGENARIRLEPRRGSHARIRVVADPSVRVRLERKAAIPA